MNCSAAAGAALAVALLASACATPAARAPSAPEASASGEPAALAPTTTAESLAVGAAMLHGTLIVPGVSSPPVALIIAGSGPTDRDGNSPALPGKNNSLRYLAEGLAERGIASLRYDKRGIGQSTRGVASESDLEVETFTHDAAAWGQRLLQDGRFSSLVLIGHSEGALHGTLAAPRIPAAKLVTIAGAGRTLGAVLRDQLGRQLPPPMMSTVDSMLTVLERGERLDSVPAMWNALFRPSVQRFMISFLRLDPAAELGRVEIPILVVQGTTDVQTSEEDARRLAAANARTTLRLIEGMNHVFKVASGSAMEQLPAYSDSTLMLAPELVPAIAEFIRGR